MQEFSLYYADLVSVSITLEFPSQEFEFVMCEGEKQENLTVLV